MMDEVLNRIFNEDCLVGMDRIPDNSVDAIICDLPYGTTACKWDSVIPFDKLWQQYKRVRKDNAAIILFGSEPFSSYLRMSNIKEFRYDWIWIKERGTGFARANKQPMRSNEIISVFYQYQPYYDGKGEKLDKPYRKPLPIYKSDSDRVTSKNLINGERVYVEYKYKHKDNILTFARDRKEHYHPTQKPVDLIRYLIRTYTNEGDIILDNCMGSGTTAIAAMREKRNYIGFELDSDYFETCIRRIEEEKENQEIEERNTENQLF
jgi:site-specific DNA-methyltransferase (adenine-specific)